MNVLMVQETFLPLVGGAEIHVSKLAQAMKHRGHNVIVLTGAAGPPMAGGIRVIRVPWLLHLGRRSAFTVPAAMPLFGIMVAWADVVHGHNSARFSRLAGAWARLLGRRFVVTLHGYGTLDSSVARMPRGERDRSDTLGMADIVIGTSEEMGGIARRYVDPARVMIIPSGIDAREHAEVVAPAGRPVRLATVRRLVPKNGVQYLIDAMPDIVRKAGTPLELWVVGDGVLRHELEARAAELGIANAVRFFGRIRNDRIPKLLDEVDVVVFPSAAEATSIAALEAMASGKAVVASRVGGYPELLGKDERGLLVDLFDSTDSNYDAPKRLAAEKTEMLANAVLRLVKDCALRHQMGADAAAWVRVRYDWAVLAERIERTYRGVDVESE